MIRLLIAIGILQVTYVSAQFNLGGLNPIGSFRNVVGAITGNISEVVSSIEEKRTVFFLEDGQDSKRMVEAQYRVPKDGEAELLDCYIYGDSYIVNEVVSKLPAINITKVSKSEMREIIDECSALLYDRFEEEKDIHISDIFDTVINGIRSGFQRLLIFPGTKWCGAGNVADEYNDLGPANTTDMCCRTHDQCPDNIEGFGSKYGLRNKDFYTKSNCTCDEEFHQCLVKSSNDSKVAKAVGVLYFNILRTQCFKKDYPIKRCLDSKGIPLPTRQCQEYELDSSKSMEWQFFDAKRFGNVNETSTDSSTENSTSSYTEDSTVRNSGE